MESRESMNMGSRTSNVIAELKSGISGMRQETALLKQEWSSVSSVMGSAVNKVRGGGTGGGVSSSQFAPTPVFSSAPAITYLTATGTGLVASGPSAPAVGGGSFGGGGGAATNLSSYAASTGAATLYQSERGGGGGGFFGGGGGGGTGSTSSSSSTNSALPKIGTLISAAMAVYNTAANLLPDTSDVLESQLLQQRASFYSGTGKAGLGSVQAAQQTIATSAMLSGDNPQMDVMRAQIAAQSYGLTGPSANNVLQSAANVSNLMPGIGVEGAVRATGSMQQGYNVNMLRGIGIQLRGPDGTLKGPSEVIEDVWKKICRDYSQAYGANKTPPLREVQISLQPGNALDSMLNTYFGNDPMLKQLVANGLIYKAQSGGAITKAGVAELGGTTAAMLAYTQTAAAGQGLLVSAQAPATAEGIGVTSFMNATQKITDYYETAGKALANAAMGVKAYTDTVLTAFGGSPASALIAILGGSLGAGVQNALGVLTNPVGDITSTLGSIINTVTPGSLDASETSTTTTTTRAGGGPVTAGGSYIVGEVGPELFVPNRGGTIVPNNKLGSTSSNGTYNYNFTITAASGKTQDLVTEIKNILVQIETNRKVSES